jgi:RNA recognition motif-containing protein
MSLIVENLPNKVTSKNLLDYFGKYGSCSVDLLIDKNKAIINYSNPTDASNAFIELRDEEFLGKKIKIIPMFITKANKHADKKFLGNKATRKSSYVNSDTEIENFRLQDNFKSDDEDNSSESQKKYRIKKIKRNYLGFKAARKSTVNIIDSEDEN